MVVNEFCLRRIDSGNGAYLRPLRRTQTASVGEQINLQMQSVGSQVNDIMWRHNGGEINELWNDQLNVSIANVTKDQAGVYSCFVSGQESEELHGIMRLMVRG